jgi:hypothetical protein
MMQGGNFLSGAASGFFGHVGGQAWGATMNGLGLNQFAGSIAGQVTFGALSGGIGAVLTDGNFWQGAITGGIVAGFNGALHSMSDPGKETPWDTNGDGILQKSEADNWGFYGKGDIYVDNRNIDWTGLEIPQGTNNGDKFTTPLVLVCTQLWCLPAASTYLH